MGWEEGGKQAEAEGEQSKVNLFRFMLSFVKFCSNLPRRSGGVTLNVVPFGRGFGSVVPLGRLRSGVMVHSAP